MIAWLLSVTAAVAAPAPCAPAALRPAIAAAAAAFTKKDLVAARAAIAPAAACPAVVGSSYTAHVLSADIAAAAADWQAARAALTDIGLHPEAALSARAGFLRLRADEALGDAAAFAADRAALLAANDARLAAAGRRVEGFRAGAFQVQAYEAAVTQGPFRRAVEFIATPDDRAAYPVSVLVGQDTIVTANAAQLGAAKPGAGGQALWFLDLYTCTTHSTLAIVPTAGPPPDYAEMKAKTIAALAGKATPGSSITKPDAGCFGAQWLLPGLGSR